MRRRTIVASAAAAALVFTGGGWLYLNRGDDPITGPVAVEQPLPLLEGESLDGAPVSSQDFRGHITVVNVWASWCTPCLSEIPDIQRVADRYADQGVRVLGINYRDDRFLAKGLDTRFHLTYPSLFDPTGRSAHDLKFSLGLPDTYVVDATGTIRWEIFGKTDEAELSGLVDQVLASGGSSSA